MIVRKTSKTQINLDVIDDNVEALYSVVILSCLCTALVQLLTSFTNILCLLEDLVGYCDVDTVC